MKLRHLIPAALGLVAFGHAYCAALTIELPAETAQFKPSTYPGRIIASQKCAICHSADYINLQPGTMTLKQWTAEVTKMQHAYGAPIDEVEVAQISAYLATTYGTQPVAINVNTMAPAAPVSTPKAADAMSLLNANACLGCHAIQNKIVGPAYHDVAALYKDDPQALSKVTSHIRQGGSGRWGTISMPGYAGLSEEDIHTLAEFILKQ